MNEADIFGFESAVKNDDEAVWSARAFAQFLGYADFKSFGRPIDRAIAACIRLEISVVDNFKQTVVIEGGREVKDYEMTRFGCFLVAMNADSRKQQVAKTQAYLAGLADTFHEYIDAARDVDRLVIRGDISDEEKSLASTARAHNISNYAFFQNAGYVGMYNMNLTRLRDLKGVPKGRTPLDFMYSEELAANLFRITQTDAKIRNEGIMGQNRLEGAAKEVGKTVRKTMIELSGTHPEDLEAADDIRLTGKKLKATEKALSQFELPLSEPDA